MEKLFKLKEHGTTVRTEIMAGITTFLTMAYILAVNPGMLAVTGMDKGAVFTATALAAALATVIMGLLANYPVALASGMGLNAYFAFSVCLGSLKDETDPWKIALTAVLIEGVIFIILSLFKFRETLVNTVPENLKHGITAGIGLFIAIIGLKGAGIVVSDPSTLVALGDLSTAPVALAMIGILVIGVMLYFNVKGAILWGILATWILGIIAELCGWYVVDVEKEAYSLIPQFSSASDFLPKSLAPTFFQFNFGYVAKNFANFAIIVFSFLFVDLFEQGQPARQGRKAAEGWPRADGRCHRYGCGHLPGHLHRHQLCGKQRRRGRGRPHRSDGAHNRGAVHRSPVPLTHLPCDPRLRYRACAGDCRPVHDVLCAEDEVRGRHGGCAGRLRGHHHDALHLFHRQRHHVWYAGLDHPQARARQDQGHPSGDDRGGTAVYRADHIAGHALVTGPYKAVRGVEILSIKRGPLQNGPSAFPRRGVVQVFLRSCPCLLRKKYRWNLISCGNSTPPLAAKGAAAAKGARRWRVINNGDAVHSGLHRVE